MHDLQSTFPIGSIIRGQYVVVDLLGKGAFGAVYLVKDEHNHQNRFVLKEVMHTIRKGQLQTSQNAPHTPRRRSSSLPWLHRSLKVNIILLFI